MNADLWPLFGLRLRTERLELRLATDDDLVGLVDAINDGILGDEPYPFATTWYLQPDPVRTWRALQFHWRARAGVTPDSFNLPFIVVADGTVIGTQGVGARDFLALRTFSTGSWLTRRAQGRGFGKEMRGAVLAFGFTCLNAATATSAARQSTERSIKVTQSLGYRENGRYPFLFGDEPGEEVNFRLDRADWDTRPDRSAVEIVGWEACSAMFTSPLSDET
ncbi:MAG: GNAT family protein [Actinomycetota bacterium]